MTKVSIIIPTHNRTTLLKKAIESVLSQTFVDFEVIIVDDGITERADEIVRSFSDARLRYLQHDQERGGSAARNTGIRNAQGEFVAFLDDDDQWQPKKLEVQIGALKHTQSDVGFCFSAVKNIYDTKEIITQVSDGVADYHELALEWFKGFLTSTLIVKRYVFDDVGLFDELLPSHQEPDLIIRISKKYKGLAINKPLVNMNVQSSHSHIGSDLNKRVKGLEMILNKHMEEFKKYPHFLAEHYFQLGLFYRDSQEYKPAERAFRDAFKTKFKFKYYLHFLSLLFDGKLLFIKKYL